MYIIQFPANLTSRIS